ncbi:MAG: glutathione S-transferase [Pseudomonadota bacterium]
MTYDLLIGDRAYSSWSLRGWLLFERFGIPVTTLAARMYDPDFPAKLATFPPARTVPAMRTPDGVVVADTLAMAEELSTRHPDAGVWPDDPAARATARMMAAEMHSSFGALRSQCPMNLLTAYTGMDIDADLRADLDRLETIWAHARRMAGPGAWLFGRYSAADVFFAPVAARIAGYDLPVGPDAAAYVDTHLADPGFTAWRASALDENRVLDRYDRPFARRPWPANGIASR